MATAQTDAPKQRKPLRLWPGVVLAVLVAIGRFVLPYVAPSTFMYGMLGGAAGALLIILWWLFFSRAPWRDRLGGLALIVVAVIVTRPLLHESIQGGMMGMMFYFFAIPLATIAFVAGVAGTRNLPDRQRRAVVAACVVAACLVWTLVRTAGMTGKGFSEFAWRWSETPEERLLAQAVKDRAAGATGSAAAATGTEWPGFRGADRDGVVHGAQIATDWSASPPVELWRRAVGPGWSSFAVRGERVFTQEQRGEDEVVSCYHAKTGEPIWIHKDAARFWESNAGAGPRGTPTLTADRVISLGGTGIVNVLDIDDGSVVWSRNAAKDTGAKTPGWGFSGSPLVVGDLVIIPTGGILAAYDLATGEPRWQGPKGGGGYSSPQLATIGGVEQVVFMSNDPGVIGVSPADGKVLWQHELPSGTRIVQPGMTPEGDLLLSEGDSSDLHRIAVAQGPGGWKVEERWTSDGLKPYFNDFVVHEGHVYGFDGSAIVAIDLADGTRKWEGGDYGYGQLVLLADQDLLLVLTEAGELALVKAVPGAHEELGRVPAIEGKTWNHPVLAGDTVLVRNDQEMAAFRLAPARG